MISGPLPPNIIKCLPPEEQAKYLAATRAAEKQYIAESEKTEQLLFDKWLKEQRAAGRLYWINSPSHKPSTITVGHPDYTIWIKAQVIQIEMKVAGGKLSPDQVQVIGELEDLEHIVWIAWSHHEARRIVEFYLNQSATRANNGSIISQERTTQGSTDLAGKRDVQAADRGGTAADDVARTLRSHSDYSDLP